MRLRIHPSARKHGIPDADIEHAVRHAMSIHDHDDYLCIYLGPGRNAEMLEVATVIHVGRIEIAIHAMRMRPKYRASLPGE
jgi:GNAT superfamily N-acetyltransferase